jgi:DNA replication and repair protein RecF
MISNIRLQNFRSYIDDGFEFEAGINVIVGPNAHGKTNLLEAVLVLFRGSSFRAKDIELISYNKPWGRIEGVVSGHQRVVKLQQDNKPTKTVDVDGKQFSRITSSVKLPIVLFEPSMLSLLSGSPEQRRNYLDDLLEQIEPGYSVIKRKYLRVLGQRNSLLKNHNRPSLEQLFPWNIRLSQLAGQIIEARINLCQKINKQLPQVYADLAGGNVITAILYKSQLPNIDYETHHLKQLENNLDNDIRSGFTSHGPHRDDFIFLYNDHPTSLYASRGEMRTAVLALKILELDIIEKELDTKPVLLLDDVFSELDGHRRRALITRLSGHQAFITTTDADVVLHELNNKCNIIALN